MPAPPAKNTDTRRVFYLTQGIFTGGQALTACTTGFHMASIWEIDDTTVLRYDSTLGRTNGDSVPGGPPAVDLGITLDPATPIGWIRIGVEGSSCQNWTSSSSADLGYIGVAGVDKTNAVARFFVNEGFLSCDRTASGVQYNVGVWCVQD